MKDPRRTRLTRPSSSGLVARQTQASRVADTREKLQGLVGRAKCAREEGSPPPQEEEYGYDRFPVYTWLQGQAEGSSYPAAKGMLQHIMHIGMKSKFNAVASIYKTACDRTEIPEYVRFGTHKICLEFFLHCRKKNSGPDFVRSALYIARCHARGHGCAQDADKAEEWLGKLQKDGGRLSRALGGDVRSTIDGLREEIKQAREAPPASSPAAAQ